MTNVHLTCTLQRSHNPQRWGAIWGKQLLRTSTFFSLMSRCTRPWLCRKRIPSTTSRATCKRVSSISPAWGDKRAYLLRTRQLNPACSHQLGVPPAGTQRPTTLGYTGQEKSRLKKGKRRAIGRKKTRTGKVRYNPLEVASGPARQSPDATRRGATQWPKVCTHFYPDRFWSCLEAQSISRSLRQIYFCCFAGLVSQGLILWIQKSLILCLLSLHFRVS